MPKQVRNFIVENPSELDEEFYTTYDVHFLWKKVTTLWIIANKQEAFVQFVKDNAYGSELIEKDYFESLRAEIYFTEFHQFETFFALLVAPYQDLPAWLYLTTYTTGEIKNKVNAFLKGDISSVTNGYFSEVGDFLTNSIYSGFGVYEDDDVNSWKINTDNVHWYLRRLASKYIESREYNAYKHGLRIVAGEHFLGIGLGNNPTAYTTLTASADSITFLELIENEGASADGKHTDVQRITKHFNPAESMEHIKFMLKCLETIKNTRHAHATGETSLDQVLIWSFFDLDRDALPKSDHFQFSRGV